MILRRATHQDLAAIAEIQGPSAWKPATFLAYDCQVAEEHNAAVGFLVSRETAPGEREILNLIVDAAHRRRGIARKLLQKELERASTTWFLEVRESNRAAIELYKSLGFAPCGRRENYYSDPPESAIVMRFLS